MMLSDVRKFEGFEMDKDLLQLKEEKYSIKSQMIDGKRWFLCPFETYGKNSVAREWQTHVLITT